MQLDGLIFVHKRFAQPWIPRDHPRHRWRQARAKQAADPPAATPTFRVMKPERGGTRHAGVETAIRILGSRGSKRLNDEPFLFRIFLLVARPASGESGQVYRLTYRGIEPFDFCNLQPAV